MATVDELFSFSKAEQSARRVAFSSQEERKMFPNHAPPTRFGIESGLRGSPTLAPGCYSPDASTTFLQPLTEKPQSNRGVYFGATTGPRLVHMKKSTTPSPVKYQKIETLAKVDAYKPFGSAQPRFVAGAEAKPTPGPGKYEHDVPMPRKIQYHESFGGQRTFSSTINTKCTRGEPDKVRLSEQWPDPASTPSGPAAVGAKRPIKVFSELQIVKKHLTHSAFQIVDSEADADILWMCRHVTDFDALPLGELFVNQFPCEALITCKDLLAQVALRVGGAGADERAGPEWLSLTCMHVNSLAC